MSVLYQLLLLCFFLASATSKSIYEGSYEKIHVSVYYGSLSKDSMTFFKEQLYPVLKANRNKIKVSLIPFGRTFFTYYGIYDCQNGPYECDGNVFEGCALNFMQNKTDLEKVEYVICEFTTNAAVNGVYKCVEDAGIEADLVSECVKGDLGKELLETAQAATNEVQEPLDFVPTITIDGAFDQEVQDRAIINLMSVLKPYLQVMPKRKSEKTK